MHRGAEHTFDISADYRKLANTNLLRCLCGANLFDLGLTTEYLNLRVPSIIIRQKRFHAFFCPMTRPVGLVFTLRQCPRNCSERQWLSEPL